MERRYEPGRWLIVSALFGLVGPDRAFEPYDVTLRDMTSSERHASMRVAEGLSARFDQTTTLWLYAGSLYREPPNLVPNPTRALLAGLRIGQKCARYRQRLRDVEPDTARIGRRLATPASPRSVPFQMPLQVVRRIS
jgi:hypothetical protein